MAEYEPNFNDPRVINRCNKAIVFVTTWVSAKTPQWLSTRYIDHKDHLGSMRNPLSKFLREKLLVCVDPYFNAETKTCKQYILNEKGLAEIRGLIKTTQQTLLCSGSLKQQLETGIFQYNDKSSRKYNPIQNMKRNVKKQLFAEQGYIWNYDIQGCAPTLIHQYAQHCGMDEWLFYINELLKDRTAIRQRLADECEVDVDVIKRIITGLFQGLVLSKHHTAECYKHLGGDYARIEFLKQDPFLIGLREDIKTCWKYITPMLPRRTRVNHKGRTVNVRVTGVRKTGLYRDLERQVQSVIESFVKETNQKFFLEHDGWCCEKEIDEEILKQRIYEKTGFRILFEKESLIKTTQQTLFCSGSLPKKEK